MKRTPCSLVKLFTLYKLDWCSQQMTMISASLATLWNQNRVVDGKDCALIRTVELCRPLVPERTLTLFKLKTQHRYVECCELALRNIDKHVCGFPQYYHWLIKKKFTSYWNFILQQFSRYSRFLWLPCLRKTYSCLPISVTNNNS